MFILLTEVFYSIFYVLYIFKKVIYIIKTILNIKGRLNLYQ